MNPRPGTWAEVKPGVVIQDPKLKHWLVVTEALNSKGARWLQIMSSQKEIRAIPARPDDEPVTIMEASEPEAIMLAGSELGARVLERENDKTLPLRAMRFRMDPINVRGAGGKARIRDHIDMLHSVYVDDNYKTKKTEQLVREHEEMHSEEHMTMTTPHHHGGAT